MLRQNVSLRFLLAVAAGFALGTCLGCGNPVVTQCRIDAIRSLPEDETKISLGDVVTVVREIQACKALQVAPSTGPDGGAPP